MKSSPTSLRCDLIQHHIEKKKRCCFISTLDNVMKCFTLVTDVMFDEGETFLNRIEIGRVGREIYKFDSPMVKLGKVGNQKCRKQQTSLHKVPPLQGHGESYNCQGWGHSVELGMDSSWQGHPPTTP